MSYQMYITEALVCGSRDSNTSDRAYLLFTREAGMLWASARSVREERSKQRYALQDFSYIRVTLVKGKGGWRIAGVESVLNYYFKHKDRGARTLLRNIVRLLRRVMSGESPQPVLFDYVLRSLKYSNGSREERELVMTLRILKELGYVAPHKAYDTLLESELDERAPVLSEKTQKLCEKTIEHALEMSQL